MRIVLFESVPKVGLVDTVIEPPQGVHAGLVFLEFPGHVTEIIDAFPYNQIVFITRNIFVRLICDKAHTHLLFDGFVIWNQFSAHFHPFYFVIFCCPPLVCI